MITVISMDTSLSVTDDIITMSPASLSLNFMNQSRLESDNDLTYVKILYVES